MSSTIIGDNPASEKVFQAKKICYNLKDGNKSERKQALINLQAYLHNLKGTCTEEDLKNIFDETYMFTINALRDSSEPVREQTLKFLTFLIIDTLPLNDYYLTYTFPVLVERLGTPELVEDSEELRLQSIQFLRAIIDRYSKTEQLRPFLNDIVTILCETVKDKFPALKEASCECVMEVSRALPRDFHSQAISLVKPVLSAFGHQRFKIRIAAVTCIGELIMHSDYKALEESVGPLAERLFDQIPSVRRTVAKVAARLLLQYRDRYSFFHKLLPLILTGLNDEVPETRAEAHELWATIGLQYEKENENDLKDQMDYLTTPPKYYPRNLTRPNLGCRVLVQRNVGKIAPALALELGSWQADVQVRCSQLLCAIALHAEDGLTQHLQELLCAMYWSARNDDKRVVENIATAGEYMGLFVPAETWLKLIVPAIENEAHYGHLLVFAALVRGAPKEYLKGDLVGIAKVLADDDVCRSRKMRYQKELLACVKSILVKLDPSEDNTEVGGYLFTIIITLISIRDKDNTDLNTTLLDDLSNAMGLNSAQTLWNSYSNDLLAKVSKDPETWTVITIERCVFETFLLESGEAFGDNLTAIAAILTKSLATTCDPESRLRIFVALSAALDRKDVIFKNATDDLNDFLQVLISDVLVPSLVWHAGRTAEAMRTMAASCLRSALTPKIDVDLFATGNLLRPLFDRLLPLLLSLGEDASFKSRLLAIEDVVLLKRAAVEKGVWKLDDLLKVYPEILKRLDDPTDKVRICATKLLPSLLENPPVEFLKDSFEPHHELIVDTLLTHFDDDDKDFQALVLDVLKAMSAVNANKLRDKIEKMRKLLRNKKGCDEVMAYLTNLKIED